jgi:predicted kinase
MTIDDVYAHLQKTMPKVVYLSGKTSTGKSTLAQKLHTTANYQIVELDTVVVQSVIEPLALTDGGQVFVEIYKKRKQLDWIKRFIQAARQRILDHIAAGHPVIIDGAIANVETINSCWQVYRNQLLSICTLKILPTMNVILPAALSKPAQRVTQVCRPVFGR